MGRFHKNLNITSKNIPFFFPLWQALGREGKGTDFFFFFIIMGRERMFLVRKKHSLARGLATKPSSLPF